MRKKRDSIKKFKEIKYSIDRLTKYNMCNFLCTFFSLNDFYDINFSSPKYMYKYLKTLLTRVLFTRVLIYKL